MKFSNFIFLVALMGCNDLLEKSDVIGTYQLIKNHNQVELKLFEDDSFKYTVMTSEGKRFESNGSWALYNFSGKPVLHLDQVVYVDICDDPHDNPMRNGTIEESNSEISSNFFGGIVIAFCTDGSVLKKSE